MTIQRKLIEFDLPLAEISEASAREKNIRHGHPSTLHIWWARRPLASSRATAFAALMDDPGADKPAERARLLELVRDMTPWEAVKGGDSAAIVEARRLIHEQYGYAPRVLDPFSGGGSIPLEALRLGCETYANDYNPVAVFIEKATLEWPQKFGIQVAREALEGGEARREKKQEDAQTNMFADDEPETVNLLAYLVEKWANIILEEARAEIGRFYPTQSAAGLVGKRAIGEKEGWIPVGYLWARTIPCQNPICGAQIPLVKQFWLAKKKDKKIAYRPIVHPCPEPVEGNGKQVSFELLHSADAIKKAGFDPSEGTVHRANARCLLCEQITKATDVRRLARDGQMGERMVAVVLHHPNETGKKYRLATAEDERVFAQASAYLEEKLANWPYLESPLPDEEMQPNARYMLPTNYGMRQWQNIFNTRQKLALITFLQAIKGCYERVQADCVGYGVDEDELARAVVGYLSVLLDRLADYNSTICTWANHGEYVGHTFVRQALPMTWDYFELSPFSQSTGDWYSHMTWVLRYIHANPAIEGAKSLALHNSATDLPFLDNELDAILSDPPYYDNVPYAVLSDFFYVWLKRSVGDLFPALFATPVVPKSGEAIMEPTRHEKKEDAKAFFEQTLAASFCEMYRVLKPGGVAVLVYAHKTTAGWETMLNSLVKAGFVVTGSWPMHTEMKTRLRAAASAALASSIYMVCRKLERTQVGFWNEIQPIIQARVEEKLEQFWQAGISGGDFFISAIGPGMEEYSRYEEVETYSGELIGTDQLLIFIRQVASNYLVNRLLQDSSGGTIDKEAQFYLTYRWTYGENKVPYDDARKIASAEGVDLSQLWGKEGFIKKSGATIEVLGPRKRGEIEEIKHMVDVMHQAITLWEQGKRAELNNLLIHTGHAQNEAFWQFCQGVAECQPDNNKEKQLLQGLLMGKERYMQASVAQAQAREAVEVVQERLF